MEIALLEDLAISKEELAAYQKRLEEMGHTLRVYERTSDPNVIAKEIETADALIVGNMPLPASAVEKARNLSYIDVAFTGVDHIPVALAHQKGIAVSNASGYATEAVAQAAIALMILLERQMPALEKACREGKTKAGHRGWTLEERVVGIVGAGAIGKRTAALAKAMGAHVIAFNRSKVVDPAVDEQVSLDELLQRADVVSLHVPLTDATRGLIGKEQLEKMKPSAVLINTARGPVVDQAALCEALENGTIAGAGLDVYEIEPPLPLDDPILKAPNTVLLPHMAFDSVQSMQKRAKIAFDNLFAWLDGTVLNEVREG